MSSSGMKLEMNSSLDYITRPLEIDTRISGDRMEVKTFSLQINFTSSYITQYLVKSAIHIKSFQISQIFRVPTGPYWAPNICLKKTLI